MTDHHDYLFIYLFFFFLMKLILSYFNVNVPLTKDYRLFLLDSLHTLKGGVHLHFFLLCCSCCLFVYIYIFTFLLHFISFSFFHILLFLYNCIVPVGFLLWVIRDAFPGKSQLRQSRATQPTVHAGCFSVSITHRTLTWTTGSLMCAQVEMHAIAHDVVRTP